MQPGLRSGGGEGVMLNFAEQVCTKYMSVVRTKASSCHHHLNALLVDAQSRGESFGGYLIRLGEDAHSHDVDEAGSVEGRSGSTSHPQGDGDIA